MTTRMRCVAILTAASAMSAVLASQTPAASPTQQAPPTFRVATDVVTVPVFVHAGDAAVGSLSTADFVLTDNGVPQTIQRVESEAVPTDVTVLVETSRAMRASMAPLTSQAQRIVARVQPTDRVEVLTIDSYVSEIRALRSPLEQMPLARLMPGGMASVNDALVLALLREPDDQRRHLIVAITDSIDSMSESTFDTVRTAARRSSATLEVVWQTLGDGGAVSGQMLRTESELALSEQCGLSQRCEVTSRFFTPHVWPPPGRPRAAFEVLREAAAITGGAVHQPATFTDQVAVRVFERLYDDYRHAYVLRYAPSGVPRAGVHEIVVTVPRHPSYEIRARRSYEIDEAPAPAATVPAAGSIEALMAAGARGDDSALALALRQPRTATDLVRLLRGFPDAARRWSGDVGHEFMLALRLAAEGLTQSGDARDEGVVLMQRYSALARQTSPELERVWYAATAAILDGVLLPTVSVPYIQHAADRFPDEPRLRLAQAIAVDQKWHIGDAAIMGAPKDGDIRALLELYGRAGVAPETHQEALVRSAFFLHRLGRDREALDKLTAAGDAGSDTSLRFWRWLVLGQVLEGLGRSDEATSAFRSAERLSPGAQSARAALMVQLARHGGDAEARALAVEIGTATSGTDPWLDYWVGEGRRLSDALERLKRYN